MKKLISKPWFYNTIPVIIWFMMLVLPFLSNPGNIPPEAHRHFVINTVSTNFLLLCIFYLHTYLLYPLINTKGFIWYIALLAVVLSIYWIYWIFFAATPGNGSHFHEYFNPQQKEHLNRQPIEKFGFPGPFAGPRGFMLILGPFIALLCSFCYRVILDNASRQQLLKERETIHLKTELNFLRSQISPHFMFNILNNLVALARKKSDDLEPAIINLSHIMRYMLYESDDNHVPLTKEIEYIKSYIDLQRLRFGNAVKVHLNISGDTHLFAIEPMLLIPFVENAFKHGTGMIDAPVILISLEINNKTRLLTFQVVNAVNPLDNSKDNSSGIGLSNVERRLVILYPGKHKMKISSQPSSYSAELSIQLG